jgi:hypothetical protein
MKVGLGTLVLALALTVSPAGAGSRHAIKDVHGTKAFWHPTIVAVRGATPALRLRGEVHAY